MSVTNSDLLEKGIARAKRNGSYEDGILTCKGDNVELTSSQVSAQVLYINLECLHSGTTLVRCQHCPCCYDAPNVLPLLLSVLFKQQQLLL
jgi:hypothetical protein